MSGKFIVMLNGGIGNQLFQYAFLEYFMLTAKQPAFLYHRVRNDPYARRDVIRMIDASKHLPTKGANKLTLRVLARPNNVYSRIIKSAAALFGYGYTRFKQKEYADIKDFSNYKSYIPDIKGRGVFILEGYWQSAEMVNSVGDKLAPKLVNYPITAASYQKIEQKMQGYEETVGIHIRSNWNLGYHGEARHLKRSHEQQNLAKSYYRQAVALIKAKKKNPLFLVFADDAAKAAPLLDDLMTDEGYSLAPNFSDPLKDYESLMLMSKCKNFILANSTFGWWAAWFSWFRNRSADSMFIMPARWDNSRNATTISRGLVFAPQCILIDD